MNTPSPRYDIVALRRDHPLVDVIITSGIALAPAGPHRLKGLCPFHDDRTPSLVVYEDDQHFHCFAAALTATSSTSSSAASKEASPTRAPGLRACRR